MILPGDCCTPAWHMRSAEIIHCQSPRSAFPPCFSIPSSDRSPFNPHKWASLPEMYSHEQWAKSVALTLCRCLHEHKANIVGMTNAARVTIPRCLKDTFCSAALQDWYPPAAGYLIENQTCFVHVITVSTNGIYIAEHMSGFRVHNKLTFNTAIEKI